MSKPLAIQSSTDEKKLTKLSVVSTVILKEQPDKSQSISLIARHLEKIAILWQIPNWTPENSVLLAEWISDTYSCEPLECILNALKNPTVQGEKTFRLTPDIVTIWITAELERLSIAREKEHLKLKESFKEELPKVDYESFKKRLAEGQGLRPDKTKEKPDWTSDPEYQKFRAEQNKKWRENNMAANKIERKEIRD